jgi:hypothetical protein
LYSSAVPVDANFGRLAPVMTRTLEERPPGRLVADEPEGEADQDRSGKGALIMNPPSAWAVAKRDAPKVAEQCWTHGFPSGPKGRFAPFLPFFWSIWNFAKNKPAAKSLLVHLSQPAAIEKLVVASGGYDLPSFEKLTTLKTWAEEGPPKGTLYHYPNPHNHQVLSVAAAPAPPKIAQQIYTQAILTKMIVRHMQGEAMEKTLAWAESEVEGFMRT